MSKKYMNNLLQNAVIKDKSLIQHEEIKKKIVVLPELEALIPPLKADEFEQLTENILREGCREALLVWERGVDDYVLVDGHNRFRICQKHQVDFRIILLQFDDMKAAKDFMVENQLGRRNLSPEQASYLRGVRYESEKTMQGGDRRSESKVQNEPLKPTADRLAEELGVSPSSIKRDAAFALGLDKIGQVNPELKKDILAGKVKANKTDIQLFSKINTLPNKLTSLDDITQIVQASTKKELASAQNPLKTIQLELINLTKELANPNANIGEVAKRLSDYAEQLRNLAK